LSWIDPNFLSLRQNFTRSLARLPRELLSVQLPDYKEAGRVLLLKEVSTPDQKAKFLTEDDPAC
jgi:hypothetical protein